MTPEQAHEIYRAIGELRLRAYDRGAAEHGDSEDRARTKYFETRATDTLHQLIRDQHNS